MKFKPTQFFTRGCGMAAAAALVLVFTPACDQQPGADATPPTEQAEAEAKPSPVGGERPEVAERPQDRQAQERPGQRAQPDPKPGAQQAPPAKPSAGGEVSDAEIKSFATAVKGVSEVQQGMTAEIQKAESPEEAKKIQDDMREKINEVLADADIEPDAFREMAQRMQADQEFRQRVQPHLAGGG